MATGCVGPYVNGTGGWCGCNCKCCPPADMTNTVVAEFAPCTAPSNACIEAFNLPTNGTCTSCSSINLAGVGLSLVSEDDFTAVYTGSGPSICAATINYELTLDKVTDIWTFKIKNGMSVIASYTGSATDECDLDVKVLTYASGTGFCNWPASISIRLHTYGTCLPLSAPNPMWNLNLPGPIQPPPSFNYRLIRGNNSAFGGPANNCSIPCNPFTVIIKPCNVGGVCGFQIIEGHHAQAVGNGCVDVDPSLINDINCEDIQIKLNGLTPPIYVNDGDIIDITLEFINPDKKCCCVLIGMYPGLSMWAAKPHLFLRKVDSATGKPKINPRTGKPIVVVDKRELIKRLAARKQSLLRIRKQ